MSNFGTTVNNLTWTVTNGVLAHTLGQVFDTLQSKLANWGRDEKVKFYWDYASGGKIVNVLARTLVNGAVSAISEEAMSWYKDILYKDKPQTFRSSADKLQSVLQDAQAEVQKKYGKILVNNGKNAIEALDDWGNVCYDALMLSMPVSKSINVSIEKFDDKTGLTRKNFSSDHLVWYDTTALIDISSEKNLLINRVQGRDYSRKELISNGDINFSVSGHITSNMPDIYPTKEVQKFRRLMQYKGIIEVNNEILDQWGISKIVIKSFSLPPKEGNKSTQDYSFEAIGIQPDVEQTINEDTISIIDYTLQEITEENEALSWKNMLAQQLENLKSQSVALASQGLALAGGFLDAAMTTEKD